MFSISRDRAVLISIATVAFGVSTLFRKVAVSHIHPLQFQFIAALFYALCIVPFFWAACRFTDDASYTLPGILWTIAANVVHILGIILFMIALKGGNDTGLVSSLASTSPIVTVMLAALFMHEHPSLQQAIGIVMVMFGVVIAATR